MKLKMKIKKLVGYIVLSLFISTTYAAVNLAITWEHDFANKYLVWRLDDINGTKTFPDIPGKFVLFSETPLTVGKAPAAKSVSVLDVQPGTYSVRVVAWSETGGDGPPSDLATAIVAPKPTKPGNVQIRATAENPTINVNQKSAGK